MKTPEEIVENAEREIAHGLGVVLNAEDWDFIHNTVRSTIREAVAQERAALREFIGGPGRSIGTKAFLAWLDAREKSE